MITTFETKIMWFDPSDQLPPEKSTVLIKIKDDGEGTTIATREGMKFFTTGHFSWDISDILWWAYLPTFE